MVISLKCFAYLANNVILLYIRIVRQNQIGFWTKNNNKNVRITHFVFSLNSLRLNFYSSLKHISNWIQYEIKHFSRTTAKIQALFKKIHIFKDFLRSHLNSSTFQGLYEPCYWINITDNRIFLLLSENKVQWISNKLLIRIDVYK